LRTEEIELDSEVSTEASLKTYVKSTEDFESIQEASSSASFSGEDETTANSKITTSKNTAANKKTIDTSISTTTPVIHDALETEEEVDLDDLRTEDIQPSSATIRSAPDIHEALGGEEVGSADIRTEEILPDIISTLARPEIHALNEKTIEENFSESSTVVNDFRAGEKHFEIFSKNILPYMAKSYIEKAKNVVETIGTAKDKFSGSLGEIAEETIGTALGVYHEFSNLYNFIKTHTIEEILLLSVTNFYVLMFYKDNTSIKDPTKKLIKRKFDGKETNIFWGENKLTDLYDFLIKNKYWVLKKENELNPILNVLLKEENPNEKLETNRIEYIEKLKKAANQNKSSFNEFIEGREISLENIFFKDYFEEEEEQTYVLGQDLKKTIIQDQTLTSKKKDTFISINGTELGKNPLGKEFLFFNENQFNSLSDLSLSDKYGGLLEENKIGYIHVKPKETTAAYTQFKIPFQFNPNFQENGIEARYATSTILNRIGELKSFTGSSNLAVTLTTNYVVLGGEESENSIDAGYNGFMEEATLENIQNIEYAWRALTLPYEEIDASTGVLFIPPPIIRIVIGNYSSNDSVTNYSNFLTYPDGDGRRLKKFICTSVQIIKKFEEMPFIFKDGKIEDLLGFEVSASFVEIDPEYEDFFGIPNASFYYNKFKNTLKITEAASGSPQRVGSRGDTL